MAAGNSSSRKKQSSFQKKKRSKNSTEVKKRRRRRRSRTRKSDKSKKLRPRCDASVSSLENDSRTDDSFSSSSDSELDCRRRRARSRTRVNVKGSSNRKRGRSDESISISPRRIKRKGLKRSEELKSSSKKTKKKKKHRNGRSQRNVSVSSTSSDSWSCSTCQEGDGSGDSETERSRGRSEVRRQKGKRSLRKTNKEKDRHRSRSVSSCSGCSIRSRYESEEELPSVNHSRRLRSVITIESRYGEAEEERFQSKAEEKADIIQSYDDCPSCRSNDSNDGSRKEEKKRLVDNRKVQEASISEGVQRKDEKLVVCDQSDFSTDAPRPTNEGLKSEASSGIGEPEGDDLELILRQKALENLRKFRVGLVNGKGTGNHKIENDSSVNQSSVSKVEIVLDKQTNRRVAGEKQVADTNTGIVSEPSLGSQHDDQISHGNGTQLDFKEKMNETDADKAMKVNKNIVASIDNRSRLCNSTFAIESSGDHSNLKQIDRPPHDSPGSKLLEIKKIENKAVPPLKCGNDATSKELNEALKSTASEASSCVAYMTGEHNSKEPDIAAEGGSQFKQKTMSVMRGGELVQVSYKVYIPKKPPALARRQLQQ